MRGVAAIFFLAGNCLLLYSPRLPDGPVAVFVTLLAAILFGYSKHLRWPAAVLAGFAWSYWHATHLLEIQLPEVLEGEDLTVQGVVKGMPEQLDGQRLRLRFHIDSYRHDDEWQRLDLPARLNWYRNTRSVQAGERWQLRVRLKQPHGLVNPGGFDYERWLFAAGVRAVGYIRNGEGSQLLDRGTGTSLETIRQRISQRLDALELLPEQRGVLRALVIGERSGISPRQWHVLAQTGTSHLLAISGLHVGLVAGLVFTLVLRAWPWCSPNDNWPAPKVAALAAMIAALTYALLAGFQVPAQRAMIMVWVWMLAILLDVTGRPWQVLGAALWLVLLHDPLAVLTAGFWLSFAAVALIMFLYVGRFGTRHKLLHLVLLQFGLAAGLTPFLWFWFQQTALVAPLANLLAIPWVGLLVVPLVLAGVILLYVFPPIGEILLSLAAWLLDLLWQYLDFVGGFPHGFWRMPAFDATAFGCAMVGLLALLSPSGTALRPLSAALLLPLLILRPERPLPGDLWMTVLDAGQGLAVVIETRDHVLVYDTGPAFPGGFNTGRAVVAPFLRARGHRSIDRLLVSHGDNDHRGGAVALREELPVASVHSGEPGRLDFDDAEQCIAGREWTWDRVRFEYLAPERPGNGNNASCVLKITALDRRAILLPGDIEAQAEQRLAVNTAADLESVVLVAPHHGSLTSSTPAFIRRVQPQLVIFSSGYRNRFGFPKSAVRDRYRKSGSRMLQTALSGAINVKIEAGHALQAAGWRQRQPRLWRQPGQ